jgi:conjugative transfer region lipoprotein (TIGR03751 family)
MPPPLQAILTIASISLVLGGGASTKDAVLPQNGPPMEAIYDSHMRELGTRDPTVVRGALGTRRINSGEEDLHGYTRETFNELDVSFPRLPNSSLVMYVFPHMAGAKRTPVPDYATTFPLDERVEYALPGEAAPPR